MHCYWSLLVQRPHLILSWQQHTALWTLETEDKANDFAIQNELYIYWYVTKNAKIHFNMLISMLGQ